MKNHVKQICDRHGENRTEQEWENEIISGCEPGIARGYIAGGRATSMKGVKSVKGIKPGSVTLRKTTNRVPFSPSL